MPRGISVLAEDLETGETAEQEIEPGDYCLLVAEPLYLDGIVKHANGTVTLTLKRRKAGDSNG